VAKQNISNDEDDKPKRVHIQRRRLGTIKFIDQKGEFGFIEAEDFRDDVFFHRTVWEGPLVDTNQDKRIRYRLDRSAEDRGDATGRRRAASESARNAPQPAENAMTDSLIGMYVEFEIDDEIFATDKKLRATVARPTDRPQGRKLSGRDATFTIVTHHPKARRKRPTWRGK
jgi:cold shock CspA family protein